MAAPRAGSPGTTLGRHPQRVVVHGATLPFEYLRLTVDPRDPDLFDWSREPVS